MADVANVFCINSFFVLNKAVDTAVLNSNGVALAVCNELFDEAATAAAFV